VNTENLKRLIGMHGLTQAEAARLLCVSEATMSGWLNGHQQPGLQSVRVICDVFECTLADLFASSLVPLLDPERYRRVEAKLNLALSA